MNFDALLCPSCYHFFNKEDHIPLMIPACGHTFCSSCIEKIIAKTSPGQPFICPEDKSTTVLQGQNDFPKNWMILKLIEQRAAMNLMTQSTDLRNTHSGMVDDNFRHERSFSVAQHDMYSLPQRGLESMPTAFQMPMVRPSLANPKQESFVTNSVNKICKEHNKKLEFVCLNHQCRVCANCALVGIHKNHEIRSEEDVLKELAGKADRLVDAFEAIEKSQTIMPPELFDEKFHGKLREKLKELEDRVHRRFEEYVSLIKAREKRVIDEINSKFSVLELQMQSLNELPFELKTKTNTWKEGAQVLLCRVTETADKGEILYELLGEGSPYKPDLVKEGEKLVAELQKHSENPIDILERELSKISLVFTNNFTNVVDSLCVFVAPGFDTSGKPSTASLVESEPSDPVASRRMDSINNKLRMSIERKYNNDNNLLEFEWNDLTGNEAALRQSMGRGTFGRLNPPMNPPMSQQIKSPTGFGLANITEAAEPSADKYIFGSQEFEREKRDSSSSTRTTRTERKYGNVRSVSPAGSLTRRDHSAKPTPKKKKTIKVPQKYESVIEGIEQDKIETADLFDADLGDSGAIALAEFLKNSVCLKTLKLVKNKLSDEAGIALANALYQNTSIENLHLQQNLLTEKTIEAFLELFRSKRTMKTVFFNRNSINLSKVKNKVREIQDLGISISI